MTSLVVATRNVHKVAEIQAILGPAFRCLPLQALAEAPRLVEDGHTFAENATRKATQLAEWLRSRQGRAGDGERIDWVLADDSGLEVDALGGAPGVRSARFAADDVGIAGNATDTANNTKLLDLLRTVPWEMRTARFHCVLALVAMDPPTAIRHPQLFEGVCEGRISFAPKGQGGFGYDPLFVPDGFEVSFAQLGEDAKNRLSHRFRALAGVRQWFAAAEHGE